MTEYDHLITLKMTAEENMRLRHLKAKQEIDIMMNDIKERNEKMSSSAKEIDAGRRPKVRMQDCLACHQGKRGFPPASTDCARCHR